MADLFGDVKDTASEFLGFGNSKKSWALKGVDDPATVFVGQFIAENPTENIGQKIGQVSSVGVDRPLHQYLSGDVETFNFKARLFAEFSHQTITEKLELLKSFVRKDKKLKRSKIFNFNYGTEITFICFVTSLGGIVYDEPRSDGSLRGCSLNITLTKIEDLPNEEVATSLSSKIKTGLGVAGAVAGLAASTGLINIPGGSLHTISRKHTAKEGDTFESISKLEYGSAIHGDVLRRIQPENLDFQPGDKITLVVKEEILAIKITPQSLMFKDKKDVTARRNDMFEKRNINKTIFI